MLGRVKIAGSLTALLLLTPAFAQTSYPTPQAPHHQHEQPHPQTQPADGQWHRFQKEDRPGRPNQAHPPLNQPGHAGHWLRRYKDLPPQQQRRALESDPDFRRLPPQQQIRLRQRLQRFSSLPPEQQERVLRRMETWEHMSPYQKQQARQLFQQLNQLPPYRRHAVNRAISGMRGMPPEQRDRLIDSQQYRYEFSPQERAILSAASHLPLAPGDGLPATGPEE